MPVEDQAKGEEINVTADAKLEEVDNFHAIDRKYIMPDVDKDMLPIISGEFYNDNHISFTMPILSYEFKHLGLRSYFSILVGKLNFLLGPLGINKKNHTSNNFRSCSREYGRKS